MARGLKPRVEPAIEAALQKKRDQLIPLAHLMSLTLKSA